MPREARITSSIGVYHTILRGVNKQQIFECTEDYEHFVRILQRQCGLTVDTRPSSYNGRRNIELLEMLSDAPVLVEEPVRHCFIYAWCLMGNHVHLLMKGADESMRGLRDRFKTHLETCRQNGINARRYLQRFFQEAIKGRKDYTNLLPMTIGRI